MLRPVGLTHGHYECRSLDETLPVLTDLLAMRVVERNPGQAIVEHPNTAWRLVVHEGGARAPDKPHNNHYGVRVAHEEEIDAAHAYLEANKARYNLKRVSPPRSEHYDAQAIAEGRSIARPHWARELAEQEFPGRGYVPQALTHGTLECDDKEASAAFYSSVLGLQIAGGGRLSVYIKHPATPWYLVVLPIKRRKKFLGVANRFTLKLGSAHDVEAAHLQLAAARGVSELRPLERAGGAASFLLADLNRNWWEIAGG